MTNRLRRSQRLASGDVARALKDGRLTRTPRFTLYTRVNALTVARLALIVPKKLAPRAVDRNRVRRLAREAFRLGQAPLAGLDCVVRMIKAAGAEPVTLTEIQHLFLNCRHVGTRH